MYLNKIYTLDDGFKYGVVEQIEYKNHIYVYMIRMNNPKVSMFREVIEDNNEILFYEINGYLFDTSIYKLFTQKLIKKDI